jgi:hypothetical protein
MFGVKEVDRKKAVKALYHAFFGRNLEFEICRGGMEG